MNQNWRVEMTILDDLGQLQARAVLQVDPFDVQDLGLYGLTPPTQELVTFDQAVSTLKRREKRKGWLREVCMRLGLKCAETMEDLEGWHGERRAALTRDNLHK